MNGTFNGIRRQKITPTGDGVVSLYSFRVGELLPELEAVLRLQVPAVLILGNETIGGMIVHYGADAQAGYEVTMEI